MQFGTDKMRSPYPKKRQGDTLGWTNQLPDYNKIKALKEGDGYKYLYLGVIELVQKNTLLGTA